LAETRLARRPHRVGDLPLHQRPRARPVDRNLPHRETPLRTEEGLVERVADGDTITVITPNQTKLRIRLWGIDAPETPKGTKFPGQPYGKDAEVYLKQLVEAKRVNVEIYGVDRYQRLLATIFVDGKDINLAMIEAGLAEVYRGPEPGGGRDRTSREEMHVDSGRRL
jgi:endonuclease YncB( thermonuclease family)